jgi:transcriptional regulator with XRE-family HTH domain
VILHRDGASRRGDTTQLPTSVPEIGRTLRRARTRQGLSVVDVADRLGVPPGDLEGLEAGTVDRLPDRIGVVQALRRYADYLGLPGERYVLVLVDRWPTLSSAPVVAVPALPPPDTGAAAPLPVPARPVPPAPEPGPRPVPAPLPGPAGGPGNGPDTGPATEQVPLVTGPATGAVATRTRTRDPRPPRPRAGAPLWLKVLVTVVLLAVLAGGAILVIHRVKPVWLSDIGLTSKPHQTTTTSSNHTPTSAPPVFSIPTSGPTSATVVVRAPAFLVQVIPTGGSSWIQASVPDRAGPVFTGVVHQGSTKDFLVAKGLTLELGSTSARVFVKADNQLVGWYFPKAAPFTLRFSGQAP